MFREKFNLPFFNILEEISFCKRSFQKIRYIFSVQFFSILFGYRIAKQIIKSIFFTFEFEYGKFGVFSSDLFLEVKKKVKIIQFVSFFSEYRHLYKKRTIRKFTKTNRKRNIKFKQIRQMHRDWTVDFVDCDKAKPKFLILDKKNIKKYLCVRQKSKYLKKN